MSVPASPPPLPDPVHERAAAKAAARHRARALCYRSLENRWRSEESLDRGDTVDFQDRRHTARLEREVADEDEHEAEET